MARGRPSSSSSSLASRSMAPHNAAIAVAAAAQPLEISNARVQRGRHGGDHGGERKERRDGDERDGPDLLSSLTSPFATHAPAALGHGKRHHSDDSGIAGGHEREEASTTHRAAGPYPSHAETSSYGGAGETEPGPECTPFRRERLPSRVEATVEVRRVLQAEVWDCALACLTAATAALTHRQVELGEVLAMAETGCTWSVELLPIARRLGLQARLLTTQAACSATHLATLPFYKARFGGSARLAAVEAIFANEEAEGHAVVELPDPLTMEQLAEILHRPATVVMVLVDASRLRCDSCERGAPVAEAPDSFLGHFVILHAIDMRTVRVEYVNPAPHSCEPHCSVTLHAFNAARNAVGTDSDVLVLATSSS